MAIILGTVPGYSDLQNTILAATKPSIGAHLQRINSNANFGMVRLEVFTAVYKHGDIVPLPTSDVDGYTYTRAELNYMWVAQSTANQATGWASYREPWTMWYGIWNVDQTSGEVTSEIGYRGNDDHKDNQATTNDGVVQVFVIAQRQKSNLILSAVPAYSKKLTTDFFTNEAMHTGLLTVLNTDAKFSVVNTEVIYMGEFVHGATVPRPISPADGRLYAYSEVQFQTCWRWTADTDGLGNPQKPAINKGQLQDWNASVTAGGGVVTEAVVYELSGQHTYNIGKVAVFAFCQRPLGTTFATQQTGFNEILDSTFAPGQTLRATTMQQLNNNINQAVCTPEFFGPTNYANGATIPVPVSTLDGYTYLRSELTYIWDWANTGPSANTTGRLSLVHGSISATGVVTINDYRLNSGASAVNLVHEGAMRVIVIAKRASNFGTPPAFTNRPPIFGSDDVIEFYGPNDRQTQYLNKADGSVTVSSLLNNQASILPNQTITLTFTMPSPGTILIITFLAQSLLRPDTTTLTLNPSNDAAFQMLTNGQGESGSVGSQAPGWTLQAGAGLLEANDFVFAGTQSMKITNAGANNSLSGQSVNLIGGTLYVVEGWIKTDALAGGGNHGAFINMSIVSGITSYVIYTKFGAFDGGATTIPIIGLPADGVARGYTFVQCYFAPTVSGVINIFLQNFTSGAGSAWFDNIFLYPFHGGLYASLTNTQTYYIYPYILLSNGRLQFSNGAPPPTSPSDTFSQQCQFDGRIGIIPKKILTPSAGTSGSDTGGGDGTCAEFTEPVTIKRYSNVGELLFEGVVPAREVTTGFESDDGLVKRGCLIKGWSFKKKQFVFRAVHRTRIAHCAGWMIVDGHRFSPCEGVWSDNQWKPAWKVKGAVHDTLISCKVDIEVEADWDDEHNYLVGDTIIHNSFLLPC